MGVFFYTIFLFFFRLGLQVAALFNPKARSWVRGRRDIFSRLADAIAPTDQVIWVHCASLGEFEQGRPLIEALRSAYPGYRILLTFFSPSGYEVRKDYPGVDHVFYLPMDGARNARRFLEIVHPSLAIFVKYEFWFYYLKKLHYRGVPLLLVSALFWQEMSFFKWYGSLQRKMLTRFDHLFVQDQTSKTLIDPIADPLRISVSGDTRFDRVIRIAQQAQPIPAVDRFVADTRNVIVAGSTWPADEQMLREVIDGLDASWKLIIAPHEISASHVEDLTALFAGAVRFSEAGKSDDADDARDADDAGMSPAGARVLVIDNIGMLSRLYQYGRFSYIGGGFGKGIHNTLEAAVYGRPVIFGPVFHKFREAAELIASGGAFAVHTSQEMLRVVHDLSDPLNWEASGRNAGNYVMGNQGATQRIMQFIADAGWLKNI